MVRLVFLILLFYSTVVLGTDKAELTVMIGGAKKLTGVVAITLFDSEENYMKVPYRELAVPVDSEGSAAGVFKELPYGEYAISVIHDANENGKLDTNFMRIPRELYAFSNNAKASFGPAPFSKARFEVRQNHVSIRIKFK